MGKQLRRQTNDKIIFGICSGLALYLGWDKTVVRLLMIFLLLITGFFPVGLLYIIAYFIMPKDGTDGIIK